ncbi:tyrosine-type recombinase/integrase [Okeanomitos corallinicola TIOX110]|uniref:Tyrosine-type recombinase/integrase n=1 Tax=Okeanomitos corallinicola TIOX110 TaxID=3133117 RepID=A0ABZ2USG1_9CYAN
MKNCRNGQAAILSESDYSRLRRNINQLKYKILFDIAWYTGERWGAICKLKVTDVYQNGKPKEVITFRASSRKKRPDGSAETRQVPIHPNLVEALSSYSPNESFIWLFPSRECDKPICWRNAYNILLASADKAGLSAKGISTHSTRRSFITKLHNNGVATATIKKITGHRDFKSLERYIEIGNDEVKGAIFAL